MNLPGPRKLVLICLALSLPACRRQFRPPGPDEPRALLEVQRSYERPSNFRYDEAREVVKIDEYKLVSQDRPDLESVTRTAVRPGHHVFSFEATYFHYEHRLVSESYRDPQTTYQTESYSCGFNPPRTCTRTVPRTTYVTRYRTVNRPVPVPDDDCKTSLSMHTRQDVIYVLRLRYRRGQSCAVTCSVRDRSGAETPCAEQASP